MYIHRVHRTQLYLDRAIHARLKALAKRRGLTVSELVRDALELVYGSTQIGERLATLRGIAGLWRDREDLGDADVDVRRLRRDTRRARRPGFGCHYRNSARGSRHAPGGHRARGVGRPDVLYRDLVGRDLRGGSTR